MKKITLKILFFLILYFVLDLSLNAGLSFLSEKTDVFYTQFIRVKPEIVFLGDSKTRSNVIPSILKGETGRSAYNMSRNGAGLLYSRGIQSVILAHYQPKMFVIQAMESKTDRSAISSLSPFLDYPQIKELFSYYPYSVRWRYLLARSSKYNWMLLSMIKRLFYPYDFYDGYIPRYGVSQFKRTIDPRKRRDVALNFESVFKDHKVAFDEETQEKILIGFIQEAQERNISIVILAMPHLNARVGREYFLYKKISGKFNIPFWDFANKSTQGSSLRKEYFNDPNHLNHHGARVFSKILSEKLNSY